MGKARSLASRFPIECASHLDATAIEIDLMTMDERLTFVAALKSGPAADLRACDGWRNIEGIITFFRDQAMGAPGTWVSHVNAGVLEGIERGIALALGRSDDGFGNPGSHQWADYLLRLARGELSTKSVHDHAWSIAKEVGTDYGISLAEEVHGCTPTGTEKRFLLFAQFYNWAMRNRPMLDMAINYGALVDRRLAGLQPEFFDWFINVGDAVAARRGCEIAYTIAQLDTSPQTFDAFDVLLARVPQIVEVFRAGVAAS